MYKYVFSLKSLRTLYNSRHKGRSELKVDEVNRTTMHFFQNTGRYQQREEPFGRKPKSSWKKLGWRHVLKSRLEPPAYTDKLMQKVYVDVVISTSRVR